MATLLIVSGAFISSCEPYEDFAVDYDYSSTYFASQKPLRTIVSYDDMEFQVGVAMGGKRSNPSGEYATFEIDESLLSTVDGADGFTLLPESYYELSDDSNMEIPSGEFIGDVTVTLDRDLFTADPLATQNTYALPIRITETSLDSILDAQDYTILVVKYISKYSGVYYHKGTQTELDANGDPLLDIVYNESDLNDNRTWELTTIDRNSVQAPNIGSLLDSGNFVIHIDETTNDVTIDTPSVEVTNLSGSGKVEEDRSIILDYSFTQGGKDYQVKDTLILRQAVEKDLRFEEW